VAVSLPFPPFDLNGEGYFPTTMTHSTTTLRQNIGFSVRLLLLTTVAACERVHAGAPPASRDAEAKEVQDPESVGSRPATTRIENSPPARLDWAEVIEAVPDPGAVTDTALREAIVKTGLPWRVRDKAAGVEMVLIPPGDFVMGRSPGSQKSFEFDFDLPAHEVRLTKPFYLGRYEVTQQQYSRIMKENPSSFAKLKLPNLAELMSQGMTKREAEQVIKARSSVQPASEARGKEWPVERVSWDLCDAFCRRSKLRLPTEAEWEYSCRAGQRARCYGKLDAIAWWRENSDGDTHAVGTKDPNAFGLYDMLGNVSEWVNDWHGSYSADEQTNPIGPSTGSVRVVRGGHWDNGEGVVCSSNRDTVRSNDGSYFIGFRVARDP